MICGAAVSCLGQQLSEMAEAAFQLQGADGPTQGMEFSNPWDEKVHWKIFISFQFQRSGFCM